MSVDDVLPQSFWTRYFLAEQGYNTDTIIYQDNQSSIKLEENGKLSSEKRTRHISIRYFFITDKIASKEVSIKYFPTKDMVADYFTKPLQGELFYKFRDQIMGLAPMQIIHDGHRILLSDKICKNGNSNFILEENSTAKKIMPWNKIHLRKIEPYSKEKYLLI